MDIFHCALVSNLSKLTKQVSRFRDYSSRLINNQLNIALNFYFINLFFSGWKNPDVSGYNWRVKRGRTPSAETGPSSDHTTNSYGKVEIHVHYKHFV